ncbi:co-chaperone GrpE [Radiomyces spectabilis]|uniref:co-chaperone GrpE n=1 Tax=Radiomyces spectabilis TaxID=64574 RepID=UPI00221FCAFA|nr:co-chaperone GrpE [Radiomyces spectabilis]KAI8377736.1 co-chaperone GrpE [Radiomyces spectabilis]
MMSFAVIRNAACASVRQNIAVQTAAMRLAPSLRRTYATENGQEKPKEEHKEEAKESVKEDAKSETDKPNQVAKDDLTAKLAEKDKQIAELKDAYVRVLADQENLRERTRKEIETTKEYAIQKFAKDLLDTVDILGMALTAVPNELRSKENATKSELAQDAEKLVDQLTNLYTGVSMTEAELVKTLKRHGVEQHNPEGEVFDPNKHQALFQAPIPDKEAGTVFSVQKLGYMIKDRVLRPAQVGVVAESQ